MKKKCHDLQLITIIIYLFCLPNVLCQIVDYVSVITDKDFLCFARVDMTGVYKISRLEQEANGPRHTP